MRLEVVKNVARVLSLFIVSIFLVSCAPQKKKPSDTQVIEYTVDGKKLYIPYAYVKFGYTSVGGKSGLIQAFYPGSTPVPGDPNELWEKGEWYKDVRILFTNPPDPHPQVVLESMKKFYKADLYAGEQYGLKHLTQSNPDQAYNEDIWIEDEKAGDFISCSEKTDRDDPVQTCKHVFLTGKTYFKISYDRRLLPEWKLIKNNVVEMFNSFQSADTAAAYIQQFYPELKENGGRHD